MFSLRYLRFVLCSLDLDVLRAQRIMGFFSLITHKSMRSENLITYRKCQRKIPLVLPETSSPDGPDLTSSQDLFTMGVGSVDVTVYVEVLAVLFVIVLLALRPQVTQETTQVIDPLIMTRKSTEIIYSFLSCSPLLCQYVVSLGSVL